MAICTLDQVSKVYGEGVGAVDALVDVTLQVDAGEFLALSGPSGSGKTTLLNLIGCLDLPTRGVVRVEGEDVARLDSRSLARLRARRIGFVFQSFNLIPVLTAAENVALALQLAGETAEVGPRSQAALASVGLQGLEDRLPRQLSGGQQQRVAIARALVKRPALVIADEPTANLDSRTGAAVLDLMRELNAQHGATFVFSTHDPMVIERAARVVQIRDGRVCADEARS
jgi:putative ABC transport system ATP-binding protein